MKRRTFLKWSAAASAIAVIARDRGASWAAPFGETPGHATSPVLPENRRAKRVLEIFLYGGLSQWETLYLVRAYGKPGDPKYSKQQYYTFDFDGAGGTRTASKACGLPAGSDIGKLFAKDALGADV